MYSIVLGVIAVTVLLCVVVRTINDEYEKYNQEKDDSTELLNKHLFGEDDAE